MKYQKAKVICTNCLKVSYEENLVYDGDDDMEYCPYCGEGGCTKNIENIIDITDIEGIVELLFHNNLINFATKEAIIHAEINGEDIICDGGCKPTEFIKMLIRGSKTLFLNKDNDCWYLISY